MNELTYYTIKNLVRKVTDNISNFTTYNESVTPEINLGIDGKYFIASPDGILDKTTKTIILERDFNFRTIKAFKYIHHTIAENDVQECKLNEEAERKQRIKKYTDYLDTTKYFKENNKWTQII